MTLCPSRKSSSEFTLLVGLLATNLVGILVVTAAAAAGVNDNVDERDDNAAGDEKDETTPTFLQRNSCSCSTATTTVGSKRNRHGIMKRPQIIQQWVILQEILIALASSAAPVDAVIFEVDRPFFFFEIRSE